MKYLKISLIVIIIILFGVISFNLITYKEEILYEDPNIYYYEKINNEYIKQGVILDNFSDELIKENNYYKSSSFDFYIKDEDIKSIKSEKLNYNERFINYVPFFKVKLKENTNIFLNDLLLFDVTSDEYFYVHEKYDDKYGINYNNNLVYVSTDDILLTEDIENNKKYATKVGVILYHFFHDDHSQWAKNIGYSISMHVNDFKNQLQYLNDNDFYTVKIEELEKYIDEVIRLPEKSVLLTADDGNYSVFELAYPIIEQYKINLAVFGVTAWDKDVAMFNTKYAEVHSHSHDLHQGGCNIGAQGGLLQCINFDDGVNDLKTARELLNGSTYFAYPFGEYGGHAIDIVKEAGITMAFSTDYGKVKVNDNKLTIKRMYIYKDTGLNGFINMVN